MKVTDLVAFFLFLYQKNMTDIFHKMTEKIRWHND